MKLIDLYNNASIILEAVYTNKRELESNIFFLLSYILNKKPSLIKQDFNKNISKSKIKIFYNYIHRALKQEPVQYIVGKTEFYGIEYIVKKKVLIPRFDSEIIVEEILKHYTEHFTFLDLCCGSSCIGASVLLNTKNSFCYFLDIDNTAIENTKLNIKKHKLSSRAKIIKSDLFSNLNFKDFDFIVSNPPYLKTEELKSIYVNLNLYEPNTAFDGGTDGLYFYKKIKEDIKTYLKPEGKLFIEIPAYNKAKIIKIFNNLNLLKTVKDLNKLDRALVFTNKIKKLNKITKLTDN